MVIASSAVEALELLDRAGADVVLSDVRMPGMTGVELLHELRRRKADAVVVLMTAYATVPDAVEAMRAGAYDYLTKPFALDDVGQVVSRALDRYQLIKVPIDVYQVSHIPFRVVPLNVVIIVAGRWPFAFSRRSIPRGRQRCSIPSRR